MQTVVDLRRMDRPCKQSVNVHERRLRKLWHDIRMVGPRHFPLVILSTPLLLTSQIEQADVSDVIFLSSTGHEAGCFGVLTGV